MIKYAPFDERQTEYIRRTKDSWLNVAEGGKRAGKNIMNVVAWAAAIDDSDDVLHLAAGVSQSSARMNIIDSDGMGLEHIFAGRCKYGQYNGRDALLIDTRKGKKAVIIAGGGDSRSASLIKGHSYGSVYITEVNECSQTFVQEAIDRTLASSKRQIFFDLNPKPPSHWFYRDFLDYQDELKARGENPGYNYGHFTILNNLSISDAQIRDTLSKYDKGSIWYQCDILGLRTSAEGRIYTGYYYDDCAISAEEISKMNFCELSVGIDVGGTDATAATLTGLTTDRKTVVHIDGMYHKQGLSNKMTEAKYAQLVVDWLSPWTKIYPKIGTIYADSANKLFRTALQNELIRRGMTRLNVVAFNKSDGIIERIELSEMLLNQGRYKINNRMEKWHEAYQMAVWSDKEYEKGDWVRVDDGSYPVDCLDSAEYSLYPLKQFLIN